MSGRDIVVVGASAGGVEALCELARGLPAGLPAALFVVYHFPATARSVLPEILTRGGQLLARPARPAAPAGGAHDAAAATIARDFQAQVRDEHRGALSPFTCPECGGSLWQLGEGAPVGFRCHVGHTFLAESLLAQQTSTLEAAL